jgi:hypothetical protein
MRRRLGRRALSPKRSTNIIAVLLLLIAGVLLVAHDTAAATVPLLTGTYQIVAGLVAGFLIGAVASLLGVAGERF